MFSILKHISPIKDFEQEREKEKKRKIGEEPARESQKWNAQTQFFPKRRKDKKGHGWSVYREKRMKHYVRFLFFSPTNHRSFSFVDFSLKISSSPANTTRKEEAKMGERFFQQGRVTCAVFFCVYVCVLLLFL